MIHEIRTYDLVPRSVPEFLEKTGVMIEERTKVTPLGGFFHTEVGTLNQVVRPVLATGLGNPWPIGAGAVVVDAPSLERSSAGLAMASQMDGVFLVLAADSTGADEVIALRDQVEAHGGHVAGVVMNRIGADAHFADRLAG